MPVFGGRPAEFIEAIEDNIARFNTAERRGWTRTNIYLVNDMLEGEFAAKLSGIILRTGDTCQLSAIRMRRIIRRKIKK